MKIQSLSVVVPNQGCVNKCPFCVSRMHNDSYKNQMNDNLPFFDLYMEDYLKRLEFAKDNGCNTIMLTGNSEPQQNRKFLTYFGLFMKFMKNPFHWVEMQSTGIMLDQNYLRFLRNHVGVNTISLSISSLNNDENMSIINPPDNLWFRLEELCAEIKKYDFTLRLSLNMNDTFDTYYEGREQGIHNLFQKCKELGADQVTFRIMYTSEVDTPQSYWIYTHKCKTTIPSDIFTYIRKYGKIIGVLPYGAVKYSIHGMCVVVDDDCMSKDPNKMEDDTYKYLILQPDCKLYSQWDDPASLIF